MTKEKTIAIELPEMVAGLIDESIEYLRKIPDTDSEIFKYVMYLTVSSAIVKINEIWLGNNESYRLLRKQVEAIVKVVKND